MNNFIITAMPRSGTKFLTNVMNRSKKFNVVHDHEHNKIGPLRKNSEEEYMRYVNERLNKDFYGEISGLFRMNFSGMKFDKFICDKKGVILRNPIKNIISLYNMIGPSAIYYINSIELEMDTLDSISTMEDVKIIKFDKIISDKEYLYNTLEYFGIDDVIITDKIINTKVNNRGNKHNINNISGLNPSIINKCSWFVEKYEL